MKLHVKPICAGVVLALGVLTACQGGGAETPASRKRNKAHQT